MAVVPHQIVAHIAEDGLGRLFHLIQILDGVQQIGAIDGEHDVATQLLLRLHGDLALLGGEELTGVIDEDAEVGVHQRVQGNLF